MDVAQAFDKVCHDGLLFKLKQILPPSYYLLFQSYLTERQFTVRYRTTLSSISIIKAGVPQGAISAPLLFNIFTADQPTHPNTIVAEFADDKAILSVHNDPQMASHYLQSHLNSLETWYRDWKIKINETKSCHITFTLKQGISPNVTLNNVQIPSSSTVKYLGVHFDKKLNWAHYIHCTKIKFNSRLSILRRFLHSSSKLPLHTKLTIYKLFLKPLWTYGVQIWGTAKNSNLKKIQVSQNKIFRLITNAPPYISNHTLHFDLQMKTVTQVATQYYS